MMDCSPKTLNGGEEEAQGAMATKPVTMAVPKIRVAAAAVRKGQRPPSLIVDVQDYAALS
jgi:hypothetical protein